MLIRVINKTNKHDALHGWEMPNNFIINLLEPAKPKLKVRQYHLLKEIHGSLYTAVQLPSPHDPTGHWGQVPANGGVKFLLHVDAENHFNVPAIIL